MWELGMGEMGVEVERGGGREEGVRENGWWTV